MDDFQQWEHSLEEEEPDRPLVMEQLRRFGWLALIMVPLLVITLAASVLTREWAIIIFIGGLVAITAIRQRYDDDR